MDITRAISIGFQPRFSIERGIQETVDWYKKNRDIVGSRFNVFKNRQDR
jgi:nucleoside-diphosphate-sugar epimerase